MDIVAANQPAYALFSQMYLHPAHPANRAGSSSSTPA
jgi:hypothetical protein